MPADGEPFELRDAISAYRWALDYTHRMLAYFQAIMVGAVVVAWTGEMARSGRLLWLLTAGVVAFALPNGFLVVSYQAKAVTIAEAVRAYWTANRSRIPDDLRELNGIFDAAPARFVLLMHAGLSLAVIVAIWLRTWFDIS